MRGAPGINVTTTGADRIIPADAGSTLWPSQDDPERKDHPRGCGEHARIGACRSDSRGSSPRMRGALRLTVRRLRKARIIPADAGSTPGVSVGILRIEDHPRGCGEHSINRPALRQCIGSSPRMRGAPLRRESVPHSSRIIPADAGSTCTSASPRPIPRDHPRGCGEHDSFTLLGSCVVGSSPRMRGAHLITQYVTAGGRIIPADAGSTAE